jgi:hypothetical protein
LFIARGAGDDAAADYPDVEGGPTELSEGQSIWQRREPADIRYSGGASYFFLDEVSAAGKKKTTLPRRWTLVDAS